MNCTNCTKCCGLVPITEKELKSISKEWLRLKESERERIKSQMRNPETCIFVDTENNNCSVYKSRPLICKLFGKYKDLECEFNKDSAIYKTARIRTIKNGIPVGVLSLNLRYNEIEKGSY